MNPVIAESAKSVLADGGRIPHRVRLENLQDYQYNTLVSILSDQWRQLF